MIANHDWSMSAGPQGEECCHNARLIGPRGAASVSVIPYDFDYSGFVNAPYATPPDQLKINDVKQRFYRGYCVHNGQALAAAQQIRAAEPQLLATLSQTPGLDPKSMAAEIRSRIDEELDYELEAQNQRTLARIYRGHPFIVIPDVVTSLSRERVIVSEFVSGRGFEEMKQLPDDERDRIAEIIFRFYFGCMYRHHQFSGDPHPGNCMLLDDGRMAFLDFGLFKRIPASVAEFELHTQRLGIERRGADLIALLHSGGFIGDPSYYDEQGILEQFDDFTWWYTRDEEVRLDPEVATEVIIQMSDPRSRHFGKMRHETLPPDHLFGRRLEMLTLAVMSQLRARGNWHRIAREWIYGDAPVTALGAAEAEFYAGRGARA